MRQQYFIATLLAAAIGSAAASAYATEPAGEPDGQNPMSIQAPQPPQPRMPPPGWSFPGQHPEGPMMAFGGDMPMLPPGPPGGFPRGQNPALAIAGKLSALETLIGIRSAQLDAWRDYTNALTDFLAFPKHQPAGSPPADAAAASQSDRDAGKQGELFGEQMADHLLDRAGKATALKEKALALRNVLTADQLAKLEDAERSLVPGPHAFR